MNKKDEIVTDGGHEVTDNGVITNDEVTIDDISKQQLENTDIDVEKANELSKTELIALLSEAVSENDTKEKNEGNDGDVASAEEIQSRTDNGKNEDKEQKVIDEYTSIEKQIIPGEAILVETSGNTEEKNTVRRKMLDLTTENNRNVLLVQYHPISTEVLKEISDVANTVKLVMIGYTQEIPNSISETVTVEEIDDPSDVTRLGILATGTVDSWSEYDGGVSVSVDSIDEIFRQKTTEGTFRFLHILIGKLSTLETMTHFFVNKSVVGDHDINTIKTLFDDVMSVDKK